MEDQLLEHYGPNYIFRNGTPLIQECFFYEPLCRAIALGLDTNIRVRYHGEYISLLLFSLLYPASLAQYELLKPIAKFKDENEEREAALILHMHEICDLVSVNNNPEIIDEKLLATLQLLQDSDSLWYFPIISNFVIAINLRFKFYKQSTKEIMQNIVRLLIAKGVNCEQQANRILS